MSQDFWSQILGNNSVLYGMMRMKIMSHICTLLQISYQSVKKCLVHIKRFLVKQGAITHSLLNDVYGNYVHTSTPHDKHIYANFHLNP